MRTLFSKRTIWVFLLIFIGITFSYAQNVDGEPIVRPQEPLPPYPYLSEEVTFENKAAGVTLAGTLTVPETGGNFTAVVLITGSGPQDRNEEILGHKPFMVIADYLTRNGIAVLRYDDRGFGQSTGDFQSSNMGDFADDAQCAVEYLKTRKEINPEKIGLLGHSEGGTIAPIIAAGSNDVAFIISLAGAGLTRKDNALLQQTAMWRATGVPEEIISELNEVTSISFDLIANSSRDLSEQEIIDLLTEMELEFSPQMLEGGMTVDEYIRQFVPQLSDPAMQYSFRHDPDTVLQKVTCPVFAVNGEKDMQVISKENLEAIRASLEKGGNKNVTIKEYQNLNHLFQECTTGLFDEYALIKHTISPEVLEDMVEWILSTE